jgi:hypothetical protein
MLLRIEVFKQEVDMPITDPLLLPPVDIQEIKS